jgi:hypothetical protein
MVYFPDSSNFSRRAPMNDVLNEFIFCFACGWLSSRRCGPGVFEQCGVDSFDVQHRVVELGVTHDVEAPRFGRHDFFVGFGDAAWRANEVRSN